jgi:hypothetical protein
MRVEDFEKPLHHFLWRQKTLDVEFDVSLFPSPRVPRQDPFKDFICALASSRFPPLNVQALSSNSSVDAACAQNSALLSSFEVKECQVFVSAITSTHQVRINLFCLFPKPTALQLMIFEKSFTQYK